MLLPCCTNQSTRSRIIEVLGLFLLAGFIAFKYNSTAAVYSWFSSLILTEKLKTVSVLVCTVLCATKHTLYQWRHDT